MVIVPNVKKEQRPRNFNRDYAPREGGYHREKRGGREGFNRGGERRNDRGGRNHYSRDRGSRSGFTSEAEAEKRKKPSRLRHVSRKQPQKRQRIKNGDKYHLRKGDIFPGKKERRFFISAFFIPAHALDNSHGFTGDDKLLEQSSINKKLPYC